MVCNKRLQFFGFERGLKRATAASMGKAGDRFAFVESMSMRRAIDLFSIDQSPTVAGSN
jgi:hypothetical protein